RFYTFSLNKYIIPNLGTRPIGSVSRRDCRELITALRALELKVTSVRCVMRTLSALLSQAVADNLFPPDPAVRLGKALRCGDEPGPVIDPFTADEVTHLLRVTAARFPQWHVWTLTGVRTGLRLGELLALQWGDVDWRGSYLQVRRNIVNGKLTTPK